MISAYVGLGSNLGRPNEQVERAISALAQVPMSHVSKRSSLYRSAPWGVTDQPDFINAVVAMQTTLAPRALMQALLKIESDFGRQRDQRWGPRTLDLDLLTYADTVLDETGLVLPHPHLHERAFVLLPLVEIAPQLQIPGLGAVAALLENIDLSACRIVAAA